MLQDVTGRLDLADKPSLGLIWASEIDAVIDEPEPLSRPTVRQLADDPLYHAFEDRLGQVNGDVTLSRRLKVGRRQVLPTDVIDDADRTSFMGNHLDDAPSLLGMQIEFARLVQAAHHSIGQLSDVFG